jgi:hypothetical protein
MMIITNDVENPVGFPDPLAVLSVSLATARLLCTDIAVCR